LEFQLPVFDRNQGARSAARLEAAAAEEDRVALTAVFDAQRAAARQALEALEEAGDRFDAGWSSALELAVESAEARYALGEGTLTELLDGRRARLDALVDFEAWRMQLFAWRARLGRRSGAALTDRVLCDPSPSSSNGGGLPRGAAEPSQEASR
jgi:outer membrane protein TolC